MTAGRTLGAPAGHFASSLRRAFSAEPPDRIRVGIQRLRRAIGWYADGAAS